MWNLFGYHAELMGELDDARRAGDTENEAEILAEIGKTEAQIRNLVNQDKQ